ncbi:putative cytokinetic ring protein SteA [Corynebacterium sp. 153RC1]|uniref:putative cytokinetic ring protein SteA n=1 Tax=unclassified Corynebacterium TaxID=2624378 RepID=UPI00211CCC55|nr:MULTISPECIES: putative cytokinetic ring protein SteA [unclassified Corynebacterium]MCQ9353403.1 putative cytokinetic ring protein SteA [Corynebacterium sp. 209RC1]MCQ9355625.1 putative cytokinetic ring protein SteA [Corynebacterium sp. 1222RC1]MCQ9357807.1 putative cytokinetic ring protein SteA [Corynebacterium sp. 122RC1]MCQ9360002.1 putative cytokinetic ring protein SteA [Corynebacterium sp. 142RC1]MCQ9362146.1 putative cytokinetic ring protein SteA [Corynebacterium sp. 153RC1]
MGRMSLFSRSSDLPGLQATLRDCTANAKGFKRLGAGDIAVVNAPDISRPLAQQLIEARPAAVVNAGQFTTGAIPNFGPQMLLDAGIDLYEGGGADLLSALKDGKKGRLTKDGQLFQSEKLIATAEPISAAQAEASFVDAQQSLIDHMEAYFGNTIQFIHSEAPLLIDGLGVPDMGSELRDRKVLVVSPTAGHRNQVKELRNFIREYDPAIIAVDDAADTLVELGMKPHFIVGNPAGIGAEALRSGARVVLPADPDGHAAGLERIQDLGVGAMTFPAAVDSASDLALLLADYHGAELIVHAGSGFDLDSVFAAQGEASPATLLTYAKIAPKLIDARAMANLYSVRSNTNLTWLWVILGLLVLIGVLGMIAGTSGNGTFTENLIDTWNNLALSFQGLFN